MERFVPQEGQAGLAAGSAHRVELAGSPRSLRWPGLCPACGERATKRLRVSKIFLRRRRSGHSSQYFKPYAVASIAVPYCNRCASEHRAKRSEPTLAWRLWTLAATQFIIPIVVALVGIGLFIWPVVLEEPSPFPLEPDVTQALVFAACIPVFLFLAWQTTRWRRVPAQTDITTAFDFSDNLGNVVAGEHRVYAMRNDRFAEAFRSANASAVWTEERHAGGRRREWAVTILVIAALLVWLAYRALAPAA